MHAYDPRHTLGLELYNDTSTRIEWRIDNLSTWACFRRHKLSQCVATYCSSSTFHDSLTFSCRLSRLHAGIYSRLGSICGGHGRRRVVVEEHLALLQEEREVHSAIGPAQHHRRLQSCLHGFNGFDSISLAGAPTVIDGWVILATEALGRDFKSNEDYTSGSPLGFGEYSLSGVCSSLASTLPFLTLGS